MFRTDEKRALEFNQKMSENLDERTAGDAAMNDDLEFDDPRILFILNYLNLVLATNASGLKKGIDGWRGCCAF